jgi:hypothetical protein
VSHANTHTQREEGDAFQHAAKDESKENRAYDDDQEQEKAKENIKHTKVILEEDEHKTIEDFLSHVEGSEQ